MHTRSVYLAGAGCVVVACLIAYLQSLHQYLTNPVISVLLYMVVGVVYTFFISKLSPSLSQKNTAFLITALTTLLLLSGTFAVYNHYDKSMLLVAVAGCCFILPIILWQGWVYFRLAFEPIAIHPWLLPVPYTRNNAVSLHLNSLNLTFRLTTNGDVGEQSFSVTAPGIKPLGTVFSDLVFSENYSEETSGFSDIRNNPYGWLFFAQGFVLFGNRPLDATLSLIDNRLKDNTIIVAERVNTATETVRT